MNRITIKNILDNYEYFWAKGRLPYSGFLGEQEIDICLRMQEFIDSSPDCFERFHQAGHITGSALVVSPNLDQILLMHHAKLGKWLQMGGHSDGHPYPEQTALREALEESSLPKLDFLNYQSDSNFDPIGGFNGPLPFDLDIHEIPARKQEPQHYHYDIRYLLIGDPNLKITRNEEAHDIKWVTIPEAKLLTSENSMLRQFNKLAAIREKLLS